MSGGRIAACLVALAASACGFGTAGGGGMVTANIGGDGGTDAASADDDDGDSGEPTGSDAAGDADGTMGGTSGMSGVGSVTTPTSDDGPDATDSSGGMVGDESTSGPPPDPCASPPAQTITIDLSTATVTPPMVTGTHPTNGPYAYSTQAGAGQVAFPFVTNCMDTYHAFGFIYDDDPGISTQGGEPDSFEVSVDADGGNTWVYGCQTFLTPKWSWQSVQDSGVCIGANDIDFTLTAGAHVMTFRNLEPGSAGNGTNDPGTVAAIAKIVVTNDPGFNP